MPRASRIQSEPKRQLLEASKANGKTKLFFFTQSVVLDDDFECTTNEDRCKDAIQSKASDSTHLGELVPTLLWSRAYTIRN